MTQPDNPSTGIRQIARQAGVSTATVSRVLNGSDKVAIATRDRVLAAMNQANYRPNAAAKALATRRTRTIAALIPTLEHSIFAVFIETLEDELARAGYSLVIATHGFNRETEVQRCNDVIRLGAEAIIVSGAQHTPVFNKLLDSSGLPCLHTSVYQPDSSVPSIGYDNRALGNEAIRFLSALGHENIAVIHGPLEENDRMKLRVAGVQDAHDKCGNVSIQLFETPISVGGGTTIA